MKLRLTLPLERTETITSYLYRLAQLNGSVFAIDFTSDIGLAWSKVSHGDKEQTSKISELTGQSLARIEYATTTNLDTLFVTFRGRRISGRSLQRRRVRVCQVCCKENFNGKIWSIYKPSHWEIRAYHACHFHKVLLHELKVHDYPRSPHDFAGVIRDNFSDLFSSELVHTKVKSTKFSEYVYKRLYNKDQGGHWLDKLEIDVATRFVENFGKLIAFGSTITPENLTSEQLQIACEAGYNACENGRKSILEAFSRIRDASPHEYGGYQIDFGYFYQFLSRVSDRERFQLPIHILRQFIYENYSINVGQKVLGVECKVQLRQTWPQAAKIHGVSHTRAFTLRNAISPKEHRRNFPVGTYDHAFNAMNNDLGRIDAAKYLNVRLPHFGGLVAEGLITSSFEAEKMRSFYSKNSLDKFLSSLTRNARTISQSETKSFAPLFYAAQYHQLNGVQILRHIVEGKIKEIRIDPMKKGIAAILVDPREIREVGASFFKPIDEFNDKKSLRTILRVTPKTVSFLLANNFMQSFEQKCHMNGSKRVLVEKSVLEDFLKKYISLGMIARNIGTQSVGALKQLNKENIALLELPPHLIIIYLRDQVPMRFL